MDMMRGLDELQAESRALVCGREASRNDSKTSLVGLEQRLRDRGLRGAVSSSALKNIAQIRSSLPP